MNIIIERIFIWIFGREISSDPSLCFTSVKEFNIKLWQIPPLSNQPVGYFDGPPILVVCPLMISNMKVSMDYDWPENQICALILAIRFYCYHSVGTERCYLCELHSFITATTTMLRGLIADKSHIKLSCGKIQRCSTWQEWLWLK